MGWLRKIRQAEDNLIIDHDRSLEEHTAAWQRWAAAHGWTYQAEAPELVGQYERAYHGAERYHHLMTATVHGLPVKAFERRTYDVGVGGRSSGSLRHWIVIQLPGYPPADVVKRGPERTIRDMGGSVPGAYELAITGTELTAHHQRYLEEESLERTVELLTMQLSMLPVDFWSPAPA
jgi:hypothetical protein